MWVELNCNPQDSAALKVSCVDLERVPLQVLSSGTQISSTTAREMPIVIDKTGWGRTDTIARAIVLLKNRHYLSLYPSYLSASAPELGKRLIDRINVASGRGVG